MPPDEDQASFVHEDRVLARGYTQLPNSILRNPVLSIQARLTYSLLLSYSWQQGECRPGHDRLVRELGCSEASLGKYIRELVDVGLIRVRRRGLGQTNLYTFVSYSQLGHLADPTNIDGLELQKTEIRNSDPTNVDAPDPANAETLECQGLEGNEDSGNEDSGRRIPRTYVRQETRDADTQSRPSIPSKLKKSSPDMAAVLANVDADIRAEVAEIVEVIGDRAASPNGVRSIVKVLRERPDTDIVALALDFATWQDRERERLEAGWKSANVKKDRLRAFLEQFAAKCEWRQFQRLGPAEERLVIPLTPPAVWDARMVAISGIWHLTPEGRHLRELCYANPPEGMYSEPMTGARA